MIELYPSYPICLIKQSDPFDAIALVIDCWSLDESSKHHIQSQVLQLVYLGS